MAGNERKWYENGMVENIICAYRIMEMSVSMFLPFIYFTFTRLDNVSIPAFIISNHVLSLFLSNSRIPIHVHIFQEVASSCSYAFAENV